MCSLVSLTENCGNNPCWSDQSWSTETPDLGVLSLSFLMEHYFLPLVIHLVILAVPNIHCKQRVTLSFKYKNIYGRNPVFAGIKINSG